jgi:hypothetical protein
MVLLVVLDGFTVFQNFRAGGDQRQNMLSEALAECNRFADLEEEKDLMKCSQNHFKTVVAKEGMRTKSKANSHSQRTCSLFGKPNMISPWMFFRLSAADMVGL